ncbi:STAS domain-containing protein [Streptomyces hyaluromycini]|uniref:STAS domain-containing protein n=1 Tax=Streptomyces hyaluromycini TaxID=1377993 RepID=A0ABV1WZU8_9ACTN
MRLFRLRFPRRPVGRGPSAREVVRLHGELDARSARTIGRRLVRLIDAGPQVLEIDLGAVTYLSPDGCTALFVAARAARAHDIRLVVTHADERARSILDQVGLDRVLTVRRGEP